MTSGIPADIAAEADYADNGDFTIDSEDGVLKFNILPANDGSSPGSPDYENPQGAGSPLNNTYNVVVAACDVTADGCTDGQTGYHKVTVKVTKVAETGKVTWTVTPAGAPDAGILDTDNTPIMQFQVGSLLTATASDGDITDATQTFTADVTDEVTGVTWKWYSGGSLISGTDAEDNTYTVTTDDVDSRLRVTAFYVVGSGREESASLTSDYPVLASRSSNDEPEFDPATVTREVSEGKKGMTVGAPVRATDDITNALNYTLAGTDGAKFEIDQKTGQITTKEDLDREHTTSDVSGEW